MINEYQTHNELNPKLWMGHQLKPKVRDGLMRIASKFIEFLGKDIPVIDVVLIGSNANYNWTKYSDIDLHVITNYLQIGTNLHVVDDYMRAKKSVWSANYPLTYQGMNIELYAQDSNQQLHNSVGVYSILNNKWITKPAADIIQIDDTVIQQKADPYEYEINNLKPDDAKLDFKIKTLLKRLRKLRQTGLDTAGEYSIENLAYKHLRNKGLIDRLKEMLRQTELGQMVFTERVVDPLAQHITKQRTLTETDWNDIMQFTGGIEDRMGQWKHPGRCTMIPSNRITMRNVPFKVLGIDDTGHMKLMRPEREYMYPGTRVFEIPHTPQWQTVMIQLLNKIRNGSKYAK